MADVSHMIVTAFRDLQLEMRAGRLGARITDFSGESSRRFSDWLRDVERVGAAAEATDPLMRAIVCQSLKGAAAEFFARVMREQPQATWAELRQLLVAQYSDASDVHIALQKLRNLKQRKDENVQAFCERVRKLAQEAYPGQDLNNDIIKGSLIDVLIQGTSNDSIARKLVRSRPDSFEAAAEQAIREQQAARQFNLSRKEEEMEVDSVSQARLEGLLSRLEGATSPPTQLETLIARVERLEQEKTRQSPRKTPAENPSHNRKKPVWTADGKPVCLYCDKVGHKISQCRKRLAKTEPSKN